MKHIITIVIISLIVYFSYQNIKKKTNPYNVNDIIHKNTEIENEVLVTGIVSKNFNILGKGGYQLQDKYTGEIIYVYKNGETPKIGTVLTVQLKKINIITFNDKKILLFYSELDE